MEYTDALEYIHSAPKLSKILGNKMLREALKLFGSPQDKLKFVHVAGTNGKGSTCAMCDLILRFAGYKTGLFTSPYIVRFNERIKIDGVDIADDKLASITQEVKTILESKNIELAEFSIIFLIAVLWFERENCDIVVLETGLGGRLDATNAIGQSEISAITSIGYDHMQYLGNTLQEIAYEKSGIIKQNGKVVVYNNPNKEVMQTISAVADKMNAKVILAESSIGDGNEFKYKGKNYKISLSGQYQYNNAAICLEIINVLRQNGFTITEEHVNQGLLGVSWPGRFEWIGDNLLLDGCHNLDGAKKFAESAKKITSPITIVTGVMNDKDYTSIAQILSGITDSIIVTKPNNPRALEPDEYKKVFEKFGIKPLVISNSADAVNTAIRSGNVCAVCGSLYLIGEVRKSFKNQITH